MKIYEIWYKIINESRDVQDMVLASLNGQLEVRFKQILITEISKLRVTLVMCKDLLPFSHSRGKPP